MFFKSCLFLVLSFLTLTHLTYSHSPLQQATPLFCPYNYSSVCHTYSGNTCSLFTASYQARWFSNCLAGDFFHACINVPLLPTPSVQNSCHLKGIACTCSFGFNNNYYIYEHGVVL